MGLSPMPPAVTAIVYGIIAVLIAIAIACLLAMVAYAGERRDPKGPWLTDVGPVTCEQVMRGGRGGPRPGWNCSPVMSEGARHVPVRARP